MATPPSHVSSQALDPGWTAIALEKFSFAVSPMGAGSHQWVHDARRDELYLVFRSVRQPQGEDRFDSQLIMSVSAGSETLERQDLGMLAAIIEDYNGRVSKGLVDPALEIPVHVVVKVPCVALRYPTSSTTVRRIQMRFKNNAGYQRAINVFQQLKFPIRNAGNRNAPVVPPQLGPLRPASTSLIPDQSKYFLGSQTSIPNLTKPYETSTPGTVSNASYALLRPFSAAESPFFRRPQTASSEITRPDSSWSLDGTRPAETVSSISFSQPPRRPSSVLEPVNPESSVFVAQYERHNRISAANSLTNNTSLAGDHSSRPTVSPFQERNAAFSRSRAMSEVFGPPLPDSQASSASQNLLGYRNELGQVRRTTSAHGDAMVQKSDISKHLDRRMSLVPEFLRPLSAPIRANPESLSQWLPPRRELPFPKARTTAKSRTPTVDPTPSPQSKTITKEPRAIEAAHYCATEYSTPVINRNAKRLAQRAPPAATQAKKPEPVAIEQLDFEEKGTKQRAISDSEEEPSPLAAKSTAVTRPSTAPGLRSKVTNTIPRKRPSEIEPEILLPSKQTKKMVDRATQTQTLSGRDHTAPHTLATGVERSHSTVVIDATQHPPENFINEIEAFVSRHKHRPPPQEVWQRPGYSESSPEERQAIINDFICENLDNEDFLKLCEDTGDVWRRIGLEI